MSNQNVIDKVVDNLISKIDSGKLNWNKPWASHGFLPMNAVSGHSYNGINLLTCMANPFESNLYMTANQIKKLGGTWSGSGTLIVFWSILQFNKVKKDGSIGKTTVPLLKFHYLWNEEQIKGIDFSKYKKQRAALNPIKEAQDIIDNWLTKPKIENKASNRACYFPSIDKVSMPLFKQFNSENEYYSTLFHECIHATGHESRLKREGIINYTGFGSEGYSAEELVAEFGAAFLCAMTGIANENTEKNSAAYLQGWVKKFKNDKQMLFKAVTAAQKAVDCISNKQPYNAKEKEAEAVEAEA